MTSPRVSIITACYNARKYLPATWRSIQRQTFTDWEWIVSDDGSTDGSVEWLRDVAKKDHRIIVMRGGHAGKSAAVNRSLGVMRGDFVALVDADDIWHSRKLERQLAFLRQHPTVDITYSWAEEFWSPDSGAKGTPPVVWPRTPTPGDFLTYLLAEGQPACNSSLLMRRHVFEKLGGLNENIPVHDDYDLMLRAARVYTIRRTPGVLVRYRMTPSSRSARRTPDKVVAFHRELVRQRFHEAPAWNRYLANYHLKLAEFAMEGTLPDLPHSHIARTIWHNPAKFKRWPLLLLLPLPRQPMLSVYSSLKRLQARMTSGARAHRMAAPEASSEGKPSLLQPPADDRPLPFVSIIVPNYNEEGRIARCIESLVALDWPADRREIVVVDNGSTDRSCEIIRRYESHGVRLLIQKDIRSSYACRNLGAGNSRGEILAFTDSDACVDSQWLRQAWLHMVAEEADYVGTEVVLHPARNRPSAADLKEMIYDFEIRKALERNRYTPTVSLIVRRNLFDRLGGFAATLFSGGDVDFGRRAYSAGARQVFASTAIVNHPTRGTAKALVRKALRVGYASMKLARYHTAQHFTSRYLLFLFRNVFPPNPLYLVRRARQRSVPLRGTDIIPVYALVYATQLASTWGALIALLDGKRQTAFRSEKERARMFTQ